MTAYYRASDTESDTGRDRDFAQQTSQAEGDKYVRLCVSATSSLPGRLAQGQTEIQKWTLRQPPCGLLWPERPNFRSFFSHHKQIIERQHQR